MFVEKIALDMSGSGQLDACIIFLTGCVVAKPIFGRAGFMARKAQQFAYGFRFFSDLFHAVALISI